MQSRMAMTIIGSRQMGKSSLLTRICQIAAQTHMVATIDFNLMRPSMGDLDCFLQSFCLHWSRLMGVQEQLGRYRDQRLLPIEWATDYVQNHLLPAVGMPVLLAIDGADVLFSAEFRDAFFALLRSWYGKGYAPPWNQLKMILVTSTEPAGFIRDLNMSPFNIGEPVRLQDFSFEETAQLNKQYGSLLDETQLATLYNLINGHPWLTGRVYFQITLLNKSFPEIMASAGNETGLFAEHLHAIHRRIVVRAPELLPSLRRIVHNKPCENEQSIFRLEGLGLIRRAGRNFIPRCTLYTHYFKRVLS